jgi:hypothetical protein
MTVVPHSPYFILFLRLNIKLKCSHFDRIEVIEAESQAVLNSLTEHDFQDAFQKMVEALGTVLTSGRELFRGWWWPMGPKLVFDHIAAPVPEIMYGSLCVCNMDSRVEQFKNSKLLVKNNS